MPLLRPLLLVLSTLGIVFSAPAQTKHTYTLGGNAYQGFLLVPSKNVAQFAQVRPVGFELFINKNTYGYSFWSTATTALTLGFRSPTPTTATRCWANPSAERSTWICP